MGYLHCFSVSDVETCFDLPVALVWWIGQGCENERMNLSCASIRHHETWHIRTEDAKTTCLSLWSPLIAWYTRIFHVNQKRRDGLQMKWIVETICSSCLLATHSTSNGAHQNGLSQGNSHYYYAYSDYTNHWCSVWNFIKYVLCANYEWFLKTVNSQSTDSNHIYRPEYHWKFWFVCIG